MINVNDEITVFDPALQIDVAATVMAIADIDIIRHVETDDRVYPNEQAYARVYTVQLADGTTWNAIAEWVGESNEDSAHIYLKED